MRLGINMLDSDSTLNNLMYKNQVYVTPGETATIMFQISDMDQNDLRYIPGANASLQASINSINVANSLSKIAYQPFPQDLSIWAFNLATYETQNMAGVNMYVTLTDGSNIKKARGEAVIVVLPQSSASC